MSASDGAQVEEIDLTAEQQARIAELFAGLKAFDLYALLGVPHAADKKAIKAAYHQRAREFHPDRFFRKRLGTFKPMMEAIVARMTDAHDILCSVERRAVHDGALRANRNSLIERMLEETTAEMAGSSTGAQREEFFSDDTVTVGSHELSPSRAPAEAPTEAPTEAEAEAEPESRRGGDSAPTSPPAQQEDPAAARVQQALARARSKSDRPQQSAVGFLQDPRLEAERAFRRGRAHLDKRAIDLAVEDFRQAFELESDREEYELFWRWAQLLGPASPPNDAECLMVKRLALGVSRRDPTIALAPYVLGRVAAWEGNDGEASRWLERSVAVDGGFEDARRELDALVRRKRSLLGRLRSALPRGRAAPLALLSAAVLLVAALILFLGGRAPW